MKNPIADQTYVSGQTYVSDLTTNFFLGRPVTVLRDNLTPRVTRSGGLNELYAFCEDCHREGKLQLACRHEIDIFCLTKSYRHPKKTDVDRLGGDTDDNYYEISFGFRICRNKQ